MLSVRTGEYYISSAVLACAETEKVLSVRTDTARARLHLYSLTTLVHFQVLRIFTHTVVQFSGYYQVFFFVATVDLRKN